jgi:anti-sigma factor RsiW
VTVEDVEPQGKPREAGRNEREQQNGLLNTVLRLVLEKGLCRLDRQGQHLFPCENPRWNAHIRSLQGDHLMDVQSSDKHSVKPWFNGKVDLSPPVLDLTAEGFRLIGGRLDYIDGKAVACIVYLRRRHVINLFVLNGEGWDYQASRVETIQGFNVRRWSAGGLNFSP